MHGLADFLMLSILGRLYPLRKTVSEMSPLWNLTELGTLIEVSGKV